KNKEDENNIYIVSFDTLGGSAIENQEVSEGNLITEPEMPIREGYIFNGWYTDSSTSIDKKWQFEKDVVMNSLTLYAGWNIKEVEETDNLIYQQEGDSYTVIGIQKEETVVVIPEEYNGLPVTKIQGEYGTGAFARKAIEKVIIPDSILEIGQNSFYNCSQLKTVLIGTSSKLTTIGNNAFSGNSSLQEFYIPVNMIHLGDSVFNNCGSIERFIVAEDNALFKSTCGHLISKDENVLIRGANNSVIPEGTLKIGTAAFRKSMITELIVPKTIETIENYIISDSNILKIKYQGTLEQWDQISKAKLWNFGKKEIDIECLTDIEQEEISKMYLTINENKLEVTLAENEAVVALIDILKKGNIVYTADDYGDFEKVGALGYTLPTSNTQMTTDPGDVILYSGNQ
ncbi:MAG: leucine-rich repeat protein, partial [Anaeroplasmataceae bacterium]|nr:leucine-rich repeat protein [Anaeroplasmataceae bacterium]